MESYLTKQPIEDVKYDHRGGPKINSKFEEYQALTHHKGKKYDALCLCNNHVFDCGEEGFNTTLKQIEKDGIEYFGVNKTPEDAEKALIIEKNGIKLGLIGFTYGINNRKIPQGRDYMVNMVRFHNEGFDGDLSPIQRQITYCHEHDVDFIILTLHWGLEYEFYPTPQQVKYAHDLVEMGADLIISHHTHCIQPIEIYYPERDKHRAVPIFYGLGNISSNKSAAHVVLNLLANITLIQGTFSENTNSNSPQKNEKVITLVKKFNITPLFQLEKEINGGWYVQAQVLENMLTKDVSDKDFRDYVTKMKEYADQVLGDHRNG